MIYQFEIDYYSSAPKSFCARKKNNGIVWFVGILAFIALFVIAFRRLSKYIRLLGIIWRGDNVLILKFACCSGFLTNWLTPRKLKLRNFMNLPIALDESKSSGW